MENKAPQRWLIFALIFLAIVLWPLSFVLAINKLIYYVAFKYFKNAKKQDLFVIASYLLLTIILAIVLIFMINERLLTRISRITIYDFLFFFLMWYELIYYLAINGTWEAFLIIIPYFFVSLVACFYHLSAVIFTLKFLLINKYNHKYLYIKYNVDQAQEQEKLLQDLANVGPWTKITFVVLSIRSEDFMKDLAEIKRQ